MKKLLSQIVSAGIGLWLSALLMPDSIQITLLPDSNFFGIELVALWQVYFILAIALGLLNFFVKPILKLITLPLEIITLGLFGIIINVAMIWILTAIFREFAVALYLPLLWTSLIVWTINLIISKALVKED